MNPFRDTALKYRKAGWLGTIYLPYKDKHPPPTGWIGHNAKYPTNENVKEWMGLGRKNIGIRLAGVDKDHVIIGIDVDHYQSGDKKKRGGDQLEKLEQRYGLLPDTWISSSRIDGYSGIRYFRAPRGFSWKGKVDKDIECISKGIRFAAVWPSIHPSGEMYWWFPPGVMPDAEGRKAWDGEIPDAHTLPLLPKRWFNYLTNQGMEETHHRIDMDIDPGDMWKWADDTFHGDENSSMCDLYKNKIEKHRKLVVDESTLHDKITNGHWNLLNLAAEGHVGWAKAINEFEQICLDKAIDAVKRSREEIINEIWRSRTNAMRKIKAKCDERVKIGSTPIDTRCDEIGICGKVHIEKGDDPPPVDHLSDIPRGCASGPGWYDTNDLGNAKHFRDEYSPITGSSVRWVEGYGWLVWHEGEQPHWERDETGNGIMHQMWEVIYENQKNYIETALIPDYEREKRDAITAQLPLSGANAPATLIAAKAKLVKWEKFVENNGNFNKIESTFKKLKGLNGIPLDINELDANWLLLGVENGVLMLEHEEVSRRPAQPTDFITLNTYTPYEQPHPHALEMWNNYLETFIPDAQLRRDAQTVLGHSLLGGNPEKIMIVLIGDPNTGKSTMIDTIQGALGDYAMTVSQGVFQQSKFNEDLVAALNKRVVACSEFDDEIKLNGSLIKRITGNADKITSAIKYSMAVVSSHPQFVPVLASNSVPRMTGADKALENRLYPIPFKVVPKDINKSLSRQVSTRCKTACLWWLIEGYKEYRRIGGLPDNELVRQEKERFMSEMDEVGAFISDVVISHSARDNPNVRWQDEPEWCVSSSHLYERFERWWEDNKLNNYEKPSMIKFTLRMKALGYKCEQKRVVNRSGKYWLGVKMRPRRERVVVGRFGPAGSVSS